MAEGRNILVYEQVRLFPL